MYMYIYIYIDLLDALDEGEVVVDLAPNLNHSNINSTSNNNNSRSTHLTKER